MGKRTKCSSSRVSWEQPDREQGVQAQDEGFEKERQLQLNPWLGVLVHSIYESTEMMHEHVCAYPWESLSAGKFLKNIRFGSNLSRSAFSSQLPGCEHQSERC